MMDIRNTKGRLLNTLESWKEGFIEVDDKGEQHWEPGYSAHSLGLFFTKGEGKKWLDGLVRSILGCPIKYTAAEIEHESKLDTYRGKHRMQDLAVWGTCPDGRTVFVGIEAKVLEPFGNYSVRDEYEAALLYKQKVNPRSRKPNRVEDIVTELFPGKSPYDEPVCNLRYQLMHYLLGSLNEGADIVESKKSLKERRRADIVIMPVLVFDTPHYRTDEEKAKRNRQDFEDFRIANGFSDRDGCFFKQYGDQQVFMAYNTVTLPSQ